jgi:redox-sensing transcriptional repressor
MGLNAIGVKRDLGFCRSAEGKPKVGFRVSGLIADIERFLGYDNAAAAVLAGAGQLGKTLLSYDGFANYGLNIVAAFDVDDKIIGTTLKGKRILHADGLPGFVRDNGIRLGVITVPKDCAQGVCDAMTAAGIKAVWNFAPTHLNTPDGVVVRNEDMAASLALLSNRLRGLL